MLKATLIDVLGSDPDVVPELVGKRLDESKLREKLKCLGGKERQVLEMRYGIHGGARKTQREIARMLGISRSYVSRIEKRALINITSSWPWMRVVSSEISTERGSLRTREDSYLLRPLKIHGCTDKPVSYVNIFTLDQHFYAYRLHGETPFEVVPPG